MFVTFLVSNSKGGGRVLDLRQRSCGSKLALCPRARRIDLCSVQDQHRMARPDIADFLTGT